MSVGIINVCSLYAKLIIVSSGLTSCYRYFGAAAQDRLKEMGFSLHDAILLRRRYRERNQAAGI